MMKDRISPAIKKFKSLFIVMIIISALAIATLVGLVLVTRNTKTTYKQTKGSTKSDSFVIDTDLASKNKFEILGSVEGIEKINYRITFEGSLDSEKSTKVIASTYSEEDFSKPTIEKEKKASTDLINIAVEENFAKQNNLSLGKKVSMDFYNTSVQCFVKEIVHVSQEKTLKANEKIVASVFLEDAEYAKMIKKASKNNLGLSVLDMFSGLSLSNESRSLNQVLVKCKDGTDAKTVLSACTAALEGKVKIKGTSLNEKTSTVQVIKVSEGVRADILIFAIIIGLGILVGGFVVLFTLGRAIETNEYEMMGRRGMNKRDIPRGLARKLKKSKARTAFNRTLSFYNSRRVIASIICVVISSAILALSINFEAIDLQTQKSLDGYTVNALVIALIIFTIFMSIIIVSAMSQAFLIEQERLLSTVRALGFSIKNITSKWLRQEILIFVIGLALGFPLSFFVGKLINNTTFDISWSIRFPSTLWIMLITAILVLIILAVNHIFFIKTIKNWRLSNNLKIKQ